MVTEQPGTYVVNLDNLIEEITKNTINYINNVNNVSGYNETTKYMEIYFYIKGAVPTYEMILNVGYLKLNEKTDIPIFDIIENIIEEVDNNKITIEDGWTIILSIIKRKGELTKTTKIKFNISSYGVKETITLNMIELYKNIESSIIKDKGEKYIALIGHFKGIGNVYYSLLKSIGSNLQEQPIPILELILEIDDLYWDGVLPPDVAWSQIGETIRTWM